MFWCIYISLFASVSKALDCALFDPKCKKSDPTAPTNSSCYTLHQCVHFPGVKPECCALFKRNQRGLGPSIVMQDCAQKNSFDCGSLMCIAHARKRNSPKQAAKEYFCCCTEDRCNGLLVLFVEEEKGKSEIEESIRKLRLLIWAQIVAVTIFSSLIAIAYMLHKVSSNRRRRPLTQVVCNRGAHRNSNMPQWTRKDFQLITCLVRSKFGEVWQARPHGSNQIVRIRLTAGSDDVYLYDSHLMRKMPTFKFTTAL